MKKKLIIGIATAVLALIILLVSTYFFMLTAVNKKDTTNISFVVNRGESKKVIINNLKTANLIRNKSVAYMYGFFTKYSFKAGTFSLNRSMSLKDIFVKLDSGKSIEQAGINITLKEGKRYNDYIELISSKTNIPIEDFKTLESDKEYLKELINKYWFLTDDILNDSIYHPLEGYLFPDTYNFNAKLSAKEILSIVLDNTANKLKDYKDEMNSNKLTIHQIMTLASIVELEGGKSNDLAGIASVFINRINSGMSLGSDVTTYYAANKNFDEDLNDLELKACNAYNTRSACLKGLPVGPISNSGIKAIKAAIHPDDTDYLFFVSDKNGKLYFTKSNAEHEKQVAKLKKEGNWYIYE